MMLTFYSYFKQATEGKCTRPKPWAWDIVNKKKWFAILLFLKLLKNRIADDLVLKLSLTRDIEI